MVCFVSFGVLMGRVWNWVVCEGEVLENGEESERRRVSSEIDVMRE